MQNRSKIIRLVLISLFFLTIFGVTFLITLQSQNNQGTEDSSASTTPTTCNSDPSTTDSVCFNQNVGATVAGGVCEYSGSGAGCRVKAPTQGGNNGGGGTGNLSGNTCGSACGVSEGLCQTGFTCRYIVGSSCSATSSNKTTYCVPIKAEDDGELVKKACVARDTGNSYVTKKDGSNPTVADLGTICSKYSTTPPVSGGTCGACGPIDVNLDGKINIIDFASFAENYGKIACNADLATKTCNSFGGMTSGSKTKPDIVDFARFVSLYTQSNPVPTNPTPNPGTKPQDRSNPPVGYKLLNDGIGISDGSEMSNGNMQIEGYCELYELGAPTRNDSDWYCGSKILTLDNLDEICELTYDLDGAIVINNGGTATPAFNWRCYGK